MSGEEKEKEDISRLDGGQDIKVTYLRNAADFNTYMTVCVSNVVIGLRSPEVSGGAAGEPQRGSSEAAQPPPRRDRRQAEDAGRAH